jgi:sugar lactone lactonase YvrE
MTPIRRSLLSIALPLAAMATSPGVISQYAGPGPSGMPATTANVQYPRNTAVDSSGNFYYVSAWAQEAFEINTSGTITRLAGFGNMNPGYSGTGKLAASIELYNPQGIAVDSSKNVYIADESNQVIWKITASTGIATIVAGTAQSCAFSGDGAAATSAHLCNPYGVVVDSSGNIYIADTSNQRIRKVTASTGKISTIAGNGTAGFSGDGAAATAAEIYNPYDVAVDSSGNVYIADYSNVRIRKVTASTGKISTIAGNGTAGFSGDGGLGTSAEINYPQGLASDSSGNVFIADTGNCVIREVTASSGKITTVAGKGQVCGFAGDGSAATSAELYQPTGVAVTSSDTLYIADYYNYRIRKVALGGAISTVAGSGSFYYAGNGTPATGDSLYYPAGTFADASGNVYIADYYNCVVRKVNTSGVSTTIAGVVTNTANTSCGYGGDGGAATSATLNYPAQAIADSSGNVYIADTNNCIVRKITASTGKIATYAGKPGVCGYSGDGAAATSAELYSPYGLAFDTSGNLYIADYNNQRVRKVTSGGTISTVAGNGTAGYSGDGGAATSAELYQPSGVAYDPFNGNLYIADNSNYRVRVVSGGIISTYAGNGSCTYQADNVLAPDTSLCHPAEVSVDTAGDVLVSDQDNHRVRWINGADIIQTVAGSGNYGFSGNGEVANTSCPSGSPPTCVPVDLRYPYGAAFDSAGNIYIGDEYNWMVREVSAIPNANAFPSALSFEEQPLGTTSEPQTIIVRSVGTVTISSISVTGNFEEADDCPATLSGGATCQIDITFTPGSTGSQTGSVTVTANNYFNNLVNVKLTGVGAGLAYSPNLVNFGNQMINTVSGAQTVTFTNDTAGAINFTSASVNKTQFTITSNTCTGSLAAGGHCSISVTFKPTASGLLTATLRVNDSDTTNPQLIPLRGTGIGTSVSPASLAFGTVKVGTSKQLTTSITNKGTANITSISTTITGTNAANFTVSSCPSSLAPKASCTYTVTFKPTATAAESATLTISDNEEKVPVSLTGTGN